ncbi:hypothetical protein GUITHDRAFT_151346 [Guillardia theta CCMP2712]|uniref:Uncharacterized protein n=1 Tax=Guillardia theta (strain CCMP2712) TaxID=905079 RepID=L1JP38_GUITC|nr:hypothetical protein GUITHDRAFT_151346 [Guillardia theta CCMP2712]EKX49960.1 hypothetical protein GUITHDRAFT_151346 [Guillardia theta CCMP2712]|eukprot:XP_005836940.1 hypothetical protein GUITHDRAFT_151346 [Guillardia theta CCMP2712]
MTKLRLWSRVVTGHQLFGTRFSESINTVKDVAEKSLESESSVLSNVEKSVKKDISNEFNDYGHHMWDLK